MAQKRKICFVITSFIHYSRNMLILDELNKRADVDLHVIVSGTALLAKYSSKYAYVWDMLLENGITNIYEIHFNLEGGKPVVKAKTAGLGVIEFSALYNHIKPDVVVVRGDRFEILSAATAASLMNIPIAHIEGGDVTGTIDESIRHVVTKLAHIHFATNDAAKKRIIKMGEDPKYVFNFGSPDIEVVMKLSRNADEKFDLTKTGSGSSIDIADDFIMVSYHPVTSELDVLAQYTNTLLEAVHELGIPAFWFWPNFDAGAEEKISHEMRSFNDNTPKHNIRFMRYLSPQHYFTLLKNTKCLVGNSSAGIKECSYLGVPVVDIGTRQLNRLRGKNVVTVKPDKEAIQKSIQKQMAIGRYPTSDIYKADDSTSSNIAKTLATVPLYVQKSFVD